MPGRAERTRTDQIATKGERVYRRLRRDLEKEHLGMTVAIDWQAGDVAAIASSLVEAADAAEGRRPGKTFYIRKIGEEIFVFIARRND